MANGGANNGQFPTKLLILNGTNCDRWVVQMKVVFHYQDVLNVIRDNVTTIGAEALCDQMKKDNKVFFLIHQCVDANVFENIV